MFRDEARYLAEWVSFHQGVGVERFILFNDRSTDNFMEVLSPWIIDGTVEIRDRRKLSQREVYSNTAKEFRSVTKWMAFMDIDEFLFSPSHQYLPTVLKKYRYRAGVFVSWILFGSSGYTTSPEDGVIRNYVWCLPAEDGYRDTCNQDRLDIPFPRPTGRSNNGKSIVRPSRIRAMKSPHLPRSKWPFLIVDENNRPLGDEPVLREPSVAQLRINHYWSKSIEDLTQKIEKRARPWKPIIDPAPWFERERELNRHVDSAILERVAEK